MSKETSVGGKKRPENIHRPRLYTSFSFPNETINPLPSSCRIGTSTIAKKFTATPNQPSQIPIIGGDSKRIRKTRDHLSHQTVAKQTRNRSIRASVSRIPPLLAERFGIWEGNLRSSSGSGLLSSSLGGLLGGLSLLLLRGLSGSSLGLSAVGRGPESEVVAEQLHDQSAVAVRLLRQRIQLSDGVIKGLLGKVASTVGRVQDLVIEDREVQGKAKADGVGGGELGLSDVGSALYNKTMSVNAFLL